MLGQPFLGLEARLQSKDHGDVAGAQSTGQIIGDLELITSMAVQAGILMTEVFFDLVGKLNCNSHKASFAMLIIIVCQL